MWSLLMEFMLFGKILIYDTILELLLFSFFETAVILIQCLLVRKYNKWLIEFGAAKSEGSILWPNEFEIICRTLNWNSLFDQSLQLKLNFGLFYQNLPILKFVVTNLLCFFSKFVFNNLFTFPFSSFELDCSKKFIFYRKCYHFSVKLIKYFVFLQNLYFT